MAEVTFIHAWSPLLGRGQGTKVHQDERNVFARTILHVTAPGGARWFRSGYDSQIGARAVRLLRRSEGARRRTFKHFVHNALGPALEAATSMRELRTQTFLPFSARMWNTPDVDHDYPPDTRFHSSVVIGAADRSSLEQALSRVADQMESEIRANYSAIHAYDVEQTFLYVRDGQPSSDEDSAMPEEGLEPPTRGL
jgi:hypothetical protein